MAPSQEPSAARRAGGAVRGALSGAPAVVPGALALAVLAFLVAHDDRPTLWWPAGLVLVGVLAAAALGIPGAWGRAPRPVRAAVISLAALTAWSYASILWADAQGDAWTGADRTLLYCAVFALFALWPPRAALASALLTAWVGVLALIAAVVLLRLAGAGDPARWFTGGRLATPLRYPNGAAALWLMAAWPAVLLAGRRDQPWALRGALAGGAVLLADVAAMSQSRGAVIATGLCVVLVFVLARDRLRVFCALAAVAAGVAATAPAVLHALDRYDNGHTRALQGIVWPVLGAALVVAALVAIGAAVDARWRPPGERRLAVRRVASRVVVAGVVVALAGTLVALGDPAQRARSAWHSFTHGYTVASTGSRLTSGLGSNRYDFYRVAWDQVRRSPVVGVGADNFFEDYLSRGHSSETPHYPHSLELRTLGQLGIVGGLLLAAFLAAAGWAIARARRGPPAAAGVTVAAAMAFVYWLVHGSADWFWEIVPLGAPAFALLGLACGQAPRRRNVVPATPLARRAGAVAGALALLAAVLALALPWLADRDVAQAAAGWQLSPAAAFARLHRAANLDPLSDDALVTEGVIAAYQGDFAHSERALRAALGREPRDQYAVLVLGVVEADSGRRAASIVLLRRAIALYPRGAEAPAALARVRAGKRVDLIALNARLDASSAALSR